MQDTRQIKTRSSATRNFILNHLSETEEALCYNDLSALLAGTCDRVTIYRALDRLLSEKKLVRFLAGNGTTYYGRSNESLPEGTIYVYCMCKKCNKILRHESKLQLGVLPAGFKKDSALNLIEGLCTEC